MSRRKIIVLAAIVAIALVISFFHGGVQNDTDVSFTPETSAIDETSEPSAAEHEPDAEVHAPSEPATDAVIEAEETPKEPTSAKEGAESEAAAPIAPPEAESEPLPQALTCTLSVRCDAVLDNMDMLKPGKAELIPEGGIIFSQRQVSFSEGESVFDVLLRELRNSKIHFEFVSTPMYNSIYIEGIGNLYEFDCGDYSGWLYTVNGVQPTYGCSQYMIENGDKIEFIYSCNLLNG